MSAVFNEDRTRRYWLEREWGALDPGRGTVGFVMLNPSAAGETKDDPTIRKCVGFAKRWGFSGIVVVNLIPIVSTDPWRLPPWSGVFSDNGPYVRKAVLECAAVVLAYGGVPRALARTIALQEHIRELRLWATHRQLHCIGVAGHGGPLHPSRAPYTLEMQPWTWESE